MSDSASVPPLRVDPESGTYMLECASCRTFLPESDPPSSQVGRLERLVFLRQELEARRGNRSTGSVRFSQGFCLELAAERYFRMIAETQASLKGRFQPDDFVMLLNMDSCSVWDPRGFSLASLLLDAYGYDEDDCPSNLKALAQRLAQLTLLEEAAMVDACERVLRGYPNPVL